MRCSISIANMTLIFFVLSFAASVNAQDDKDRSGFSGKQLFEHKWKAVEQQPLAEPDEDIQSEAALLGAENARLRQVLGLQQPQGNKVFKLTKQDGSQVENDGLGPLHNGTSCAECHVGGGASGVNRNVTLITIDPRSAGVMAPNDFGSELLEIFPGVLSPRGILSFKTVVHDRSTRPGYKEIRDGLAQFVPGGIPDDWFVPAQRTSAAIAKQPVVAGRHVAFDFYLDQRNAPPLFGIGELESIHLERLRIIAKRQREKTDGRVSGRVAGKFGWRAQVHSLADFVSAACASELGLNHRNGSQPGDPANPGYRNARSDMTEREVSKLSGYVAEISRPSEEFDERNSVRRGEKIFNSVGCVICHAADVRPVSGLFSDLLLHDMGPDLQAPFPAPVGELEGVKVIKSLQFPVKGPNRWPVGLFYGSNTGSNPPQPYPFDRPDQPRFPWGDVSHVQDASKFDLTWDALQREWRTPPLWGVADTAPYLHDGRAETLEDAILWHGGEAKWSRDDYAKLPRPQQKLVIKFLKSLRAPAPDPNGAAEPVSDEKPRSDEDL